MERYRNDPVVIMDRKMLSNTGGQDLPEGDSGGDFPPVFQGMNGFQKDGFVSPDGKTDLKRGRRFCTSRACVRAVLAGRQRGAAYPAQRRRKKGNPAPAFPAKAAVLTGNQKIVT